MKNRLDEISIIFKGEKDESHIQQYLNIKNIFVYMEGFLNMAVSKYYSYFPNFDLQITNELLKYLDTFVKIDELCA